MGAKTERDANIVGPTSAADTTGLKGPARYASAGPTNTDTIHITLPSGLTTRITAGKTGSGLFVNIQSLGVDTQLHFSQGGVDITYNQAAALGTGSVAAGLTIPSGQERSFQIPPDVDTLNILSSATGGQVEIWMSEGR